MISTNWSLNMPMFKFIPSRQSKSSRYNPAVPIRSSIAVLVTLTLFSTSCGVEIRKEATPLQTPSTATATLAATLIEIPSETLLPPPPQPTVPPVEGTTSTQINVRAELHLSNVLGIISPNKGRDYRQGPRRKLQINCRMLKERAGSPRSMSPRQASLKFR
jgi:hypothetical protein